MIERHLGASIDIHGGGQDLIFPHHENEIAQGTCAHDGELYCRYWVHNGFVTVEGRKMSKSLGNVLRPMISSPRRRVRRSLRAAGRALSPAARLERRWSRPGEARSRSPVRRAARFGRSARRAPRARPARYVFEAALEDDLNFAGAIAELFRLAKAARQATTAADRAAHRAALCEAGGLLGLLQEDPAVWFGQPAGEDGETARIRRLVEARRAARSARDYATADRIRDELAGLGVAVQDRADGPANAESQLG